MRFATDNDQRVYNTVQKHLPGNDYKTAVGLAAVELGITTKAVYGMANRAKNTLDNASTSTLYNAEGQVVSRWVKTEKKATNWLDLIGRAVVQVATHVKPRQIPHIEPGIYDDSLSVYPLADLHLGLYASATETGETWTLDRAVELYTKTLTRLALGAKIGSSCIIANMGDFTHVDNLMNRTPGHGVSLDVSSRYSEIIAAAIDLAIYAIDLALEVHRHVTVIWQSGNHDEATGIVLQAALKALYAKDKRVYVPSSKSRFYAMKHGAVALGFTHGDTVRRLEQLPLLMATDYPAIWGLTSYRVWHTGHVHHKSVQEFPGCFVETHGSPVARDTWSHDSGYRSQRVLQRIDYDTNGEIGRQVVIL